MKISITLDSKSQLDLLITAIDHLRNDDIGMAKALRDDNKSRDAAPLQLRSELLGSLRKIVSGD